MALSLISRLPHIYVDVFLRARVLRMLLPVWDKNVIYHQGSYLRAPLEIYCVYIKIKVNMHKGGCQSNFFQQLGTPEYISGQAPLKMDIYRGLRCNFGKVACWIMEDP